ncbi:MAG: zinc-dependent metalloprotease, partial [Acidimicrobiia bacterium]|nr:zinc-dependent metalloprotease [Acidimicrobiia bacterium]
GPPEPFGGVPFFGELAKMFQGAGTGAWDTARQLAVQLATNGESEPNVEPVERLAMEQLVRVAELRVADASGLNVGGQHGLTAEITTRGGWATRTVSDYQPLLEGLAESLARPPTGVDDDDPSAAMFQAIFGMLGPALVGFTAGSMVGHLAQRALGGYTLPVPRPVDSAILLSVPAIDDLVEEWSLDRNDVRLWACVHEVAHHTVLGVPHIRERLTGLLDRHVRAFRTDMDGLEAQLGTLDPSDPSSFAALQQSLGDPDTVLGALRSAEQEELQPELAAMVAMVVGVADDLVARIGADLITTHDRITEAIHRRRVTTSASDRFVERLLGLELDQGQYDRGAGFVAGVRERAGADGLRRLYESDRMLPTAAEVDAPGLWLARIDLPTD